jgi:hypothetical protein
VLVVGSGLQAAQLKLFGGRLSVRTMMHHVPKPALNP